MEASFGTRIMNNKHCYSYLTKIILSDPSPWPPSPPPPHFPGHHKTMLPSSDHLYQYLSQIALLYIASIQHPSCIQVPAPSSKLWTHKSFFFHCTGSRRCRLVHHNCMLHLVISMTSGIFLYRFWGCGLKAWYFCRRLTVLVVVFSL